MKKFVGSILAAAVLFLAAPDSSAAQQSKWVNPDCNIICAPVFVAQPGVILTNFADEPAGAESSTDFLIRFTTAFGTQFKPLFIAALFQWTPFASTDITVGGETVSIENNTPAIVYGPGLHLIGGAEGTGLIAPNPYIALDVLPLFVYNPDPTGNAAFSHKFTPEADLFINIGKILDPQGRLPYIHNSNLYVIFDYLATGLDVSPEDPAGQGFTEAELDAAEASPFVLIFGATLPVAPIP